MKYNSITIESDGTPLGTFIKDSNGNTIDYVQSIKWELDIDNLASCTLKLIKVPVKLKNIKAESKQHERKKTKFPIRNDRFKTN